uniref:Methyltransferase type 11 domain-containing protein n=2 Tax=Arion vulgaris TaxID=1028688 RepID=A0A0B6Z5B5_9EUPU
MSDSSDLREEATAVVKQYIEHGRGAESSAKVYSDSGAKYDQYMEVLNYNAPRKTAEIVAELLKDNFGAKILDVGAGTGLAGAELVKLGYKNLDAVDAAEGLLSVAKQRQIYDKVVCQFVGNEKLLFDNDTYDLALSCGALQENHLPLEAFQDIIRVVKSGGYIVTVFREEAEKVPWYKEGVVAYMTGLEKEGLWKLHLRTTFPNCIADKDGLALVHGVL